MSTLRKIESLLVIVALAASASAFAGKGSDGAGHGYASTPEDVVSIVDYMPRFQLFSALINEAQTRQLLNPKYVEDKDLKEILAAFADQANGRGSGVALLEEAQNSKYEARPRCLVNGADSDASTAHRRRATVCFNSTRLARYPLAELKIQITALACHELAHHFGFGEDAANKFQNYMIAIARDIERANWGFGSQVSSGYYEMRPNGLVQVNTKEGLKNVKCVKSDGLSDFNPGRDDATFILDGQNILMPSVKGPVAISCRNYPVIDCADWPYLDPNNEDTSLEHFQKAGVCKRGNASSGEDRGQEPGGVNSAK